MSTNQVETLQARVKPWMDVTFGDKISNDLIERGDRVAEEMFEMLQAGKYPKERLHILIERTYSREIGDHDQEVGGVMITLAAYCLANKLDMHDAAERELARIWTLVDKIRDKQKTKPQGDALLISEFATSVAAVQSADAFTRERLYEMLEACHDVLMPRGNMQDFAEHFIKHSRNKNYYEAVCGASVVKKLITDQLASIDKVAELQKQLDDMRTAFTKLHGDATTLAKLAGHAKDCSWLDPLPTGEGTWGCSCGYDHVVLDDELLNEGQYEKFLK